MRGSLMPEVKKFDVVVVGNGVVGKSAALHLENEGVSSVAILGAENSESRYSAGLVSGGQSDNFSRVSHAHGSRFAGDFWDFGDLAYDSLIHWCESHNIPIRQRRRIRLIVSPEELAEAEIAVDGLKAAGLWGEIYSTSEHWFRGGFSGRVIAVQDDGRRGGVLNPMDLMDTLNGNIRARILNNMLLSIQSSHSGVSLFLDSGDRIDAEFVVFACHLAIRDFIPNLSEALVPVVEQWSLYDWKGQAAQFPYAEVGTYFSVNHGYEWGSFIDKGRLILGGARFLRPVAGIGVECAEVSTVIEGFLADKAKSTFRGVDEVHCAKTSAGIECRPCDELPVIGPMFGESRVLLASGFMGSGLTMGFFAGKCLAEFISSGDSDSLPVGLYPSRLRSLGD